MEHCVYNVGNRTCADGVVRGVTNYFLPRQLEHGLGVALGVAK